MSCALRSGLRALSRSALGALLGSVFASACSGAGEGAEASGAASAPDFSEVNSAMPSPNAGAAPGTSSSNAAEAPSGSGGPQPGAAAPGSEGGPAPTQLETDMLGSENATSPSAPSPSPSGRLGSATMGGSGQSSERYQKADVTRDGQNYFLMANGWGPGFQSQTISWSGTSFTIESMQGNEGPNYQPASYPTVFCGQYSDSFSGECGLPAALGSMTGLRTGWSWRPNGNDGEYNAAYDIWLGTGPSRDTFSGYLMVWYREPVGQQPAGARALQGVTVENVPGTWDIWTGRVGNRPIINWVRAEGQDTLDMEFDVLDFVRDAERRGLEVPGTHVLSVAVGFEIWTGPIQNLQSLDFYVDVQ